MNDLIHKSRKINRLLQRREKKQIKFSEIGYVLKETIRCNTYLIDRDGKILSSNFLNDFNCEVLENELLDKKEIPEDYNNKLLKISETRKNINRDEHKCFFNVKKECGHENKIIIETPIFGGNTRLGTIMLIRFDDNFTDKEIFLGEYGAAVAGMEIMKNRNKQKESEIRKQTEVEIAVNNLSYSEKEAVNHVLKELEDKKGILVTSKIAEEFGVSRSVVVGALRKFESAGVIETHSLGMKGTHVRVLNDYLYEKV